MRDNLLPSVPVGVYSASAALVATNGTRTPLTVSTTDQDDYASDVTVKWQTRDSCIGSHAGGPDRAYLWIRNPGAQ